MTKSKPMFMRSVLFVPGDSEKKITKARDIPADVVVYDLEDSVLPARRELARDLVASALQGSSGHATLKCVRINPAQSSHAESDLAATMQGGPDLIMLPKIRSADDIQLVSDQLGQLERKEHRLAGSTKIIAIVTETPQMMFALAGLQKTSERLIAITWGAEDLSTALGASTNKNEDGDWSFTYQLARSQCLLAARAAGLQPVDTLHANFRDDRGLRESCVKARQDGFTGKLAIHPAQVETINQSFTPTEQEVGAARNVIAAFEAQPDAGVVQLDGRMLDLPHLRQAHNLLAQHEHFSNK